MDNYPNWFDVTAKYNFEQYALYLRSKKRFLQVGAFTGDASVWLADNVLNEGSGLIDVDTWGGSDEEVHKEFDWDDVMSTYQEKTAKYDNVFPARGTSDEFFADYKGMTFDFIYVDGSHEADQVYKDAVNAHCVLSGGGIIAFDDYTWVGHEQGKNPGDAIDRFMAEYGSQYEVLINNAQYWVQKINPKIAVYNIALNEEDNVSGWVDSAKDADYIVLLDTGSTDLTYQIAKDAGVIVDVKKIDPWRFDVARNTSLDLVPRDTDICIALDLDERLQPGWRDALVDSWRSGVTRPRYKYVWSWKPDGTEGLVYGGDKIHARQGYRWEHAVHEVCLPMKEEVVGWTNVEIHHHPDPNKSRGSYFPLLELAYEEDPNDARNAYYLAREYVYQGMTDKAYSTMLHFLSLPGWAPERARGMIYLGADIDSLNAESWFLKAAAEAPGRREPWISLAQYYHDHAEWALCYAAATRALTIDVKPLEYLNEEWAWGFGGYDYAAIAAFNLGMFRQAYVYGVMACQVDPEDQRLKNNLAQYSEHVEFSA